MSWTTRNAPESAHRPAERGTAVGGPDAPEIVLTVEDVARLAAAEADIYA